MSVNPHVLIFDSGVGGLSVAREVLSAYPSCRLTYASDNAQFPYGTKDPQTLVTRVQRVIAALIGATRPDVIVVACNTASTLTLPQLRDRFDIPFVGVVPAIKPAALISQTRTIGILATPATVTRPYTRQLIADHAVDCKVILHGTSELVLQAEHKLFGNRINEALIDRELRSLIDRPEATAMDTIVLACTHFPLLAGELKELALPRQFQWVDSGEAIARRVGYWLSQIGGTDQAYLGPHQVILTRDSPSWRALQANMPSYLGAGPLPQLTVLPI